MTANRMLRTLSTTPGTIDHRGGAPAQLVGLNARIDVAWGLQGIVK
ncbi:hypothetical protein ABTX85_08690 [Streptomyces sp. NPDC096097]